MWQRSFIVTMVMLAALAGCSSPSTRSSFTIDPARRAVLTLMPTTDEIVLTNRGTGTVQVDLEDTSLRIYRAFTFATGERHAFRDRDLARIRFANDSTESAVIEFQIWDGAGFTVEISQPPPEIPADVPTADSQ